MNERLREFVRQAGLDDADFPIEDWDNVPLAKFAELIVRECTKLNKQQSYELAGVIEDVEHGSGFDSVCLNTVKQVEQYLTGDTLQQHFGVEQ